MYWQVVCKQIILAVACIVFDAWTSGGRNFKRLLWLTPKRIVSFFIYKFFPVIWGRSTEKFLASFCGFENFHSQKEAHLMEHKAKKMFLCLVRRDLSNKRRCLRTCLCDILRIVFPYYMAKHWLASLLQHERLAVKSEVKSLK